MTLTAVYVGPAGRADRLDRIADPRVLSAWLLYRPYAHPSWVQYLLTCATLAPMAVDAGSGQEPAPAFDGASHAIAVTVLCPQYGVQTPQTIAARGVRTFDRPNIVHHFEGTDDELATLTAYAAMGVCHGSLFPETANPDGAEGAHAARLRESWLGALLRTLAHMRGEAHA